MHCLPVDLTPHVPLATVEINDTWVSHIVLDSGMAGGGAIWEGVRTQLRRPLVADADYETMPSRFGGICLRRRCEHSLRGRRTAELDADLHRTTTPRRL